MTSTSERDTYVHRVDFDERKGVLDAVHLLLMLCAAGALASLWFLRLIDIDVSRLAASFALVIALQFLVSAALDRSHHPGRREKSLLWLHLSTVVFLLYAWYLAGSLDVPLFLAAFCVPVVTANLVGGRGHAILTAIVAVAGVALVACLADSELRWFVEQRGVPAGWLGSDVARPHAYTNLDAPPAFHVTGLTLFATFLFALAVCGDGVLSTLVRIRERFRASERALATSEGLFQSALAETSSPTALVFADSLQILHLSRSFVQRMLLAPEDVPGKRLPELVAFVGAEDVSEWLRSSPVGARIVAYRVGPQERAAELHAASFAYDGIRYVRFELREFDAPRYLELALQASREAVFLVGADSELRYHNSAAVRVLGELHDGNSAVGPLARAGIPLHPARGDEEGSVAFRRAIDGRWYRVRVDNLTTAGGEPASLVRLTLLHDHDRERRGEGEEEQESALDLYPARSFNERLVQEVKGSAAAGRWTRAALALVAFVTDGQWAEPDEAAIVSFLRVLETKLERRDFVAVLSGGRVSVFFPGRSVSRVRELLRATRAEWSASREGAHPLTILSAIVTVSPRGDLDALTRQAEAALESARGAREEPSGVEA